MNETTTTTAPETTPAPKSLETATCSRCGGAGKVYTKRGLVAKQFLETIRSKPAADLKPGDRVYHRGFNAGSYVDPSAWFTVTLVRPGCRETDGGSVRVVDGVETVVPAALVVETSGCTYHTSPDRLFRVALSAEAKRETFARALAFQETLTKAGTPRKRA